MKVKHGVMTPFEKETFSRDEVEFWWCGQKVPQGEFNKLLIEQAKMIGQDLGKMLAGLREAFLKAEQVTTERALIEKILRGPLCEVCKMMIENMKP